MLGALLAAVGVSLSSCSLQFNGMQKNQALFVVFLGLHLQHMETPKLGVESELQLPATPVLHRICDPHPSLGQCQIL